jgi:hypothetical protein
MPQVDVVHWELGLYQALMLHNKPCTLVYKQLTRDTSERLQIWLQRFRTASLLGRREEQDRSFTLEGSVPGPIFCRFLREIADSWLSRAENSPFRAAFESALAIPAGPGLPGATFWPFYAYLIS